jgi:hypothetical protein
MMINVKVIAVSPWKIQCLTPAKRPTLNAVERTTPPIAPSTLFLGLILTKKIWI